MLILNRFRCRSVITIAVTVEGSLLISPTEGVKTSLFFIHAILNVGSSNTKPSSVTNKASLFPLPVSSLACWAHSQPLYGRMSLALVTAPRVH